MDEAGKVYLCIGLLRLSEKTSASDVRVFCVGWGTVWYGRQAVSYCSIAICWRFLGVFSS